VLNVDHLKQVYLEWVLGRDHALTPNKKSISTVTFSSMNTIASTHLTRSDCEGVQKGSVFNAIDGSHDDSEGKEDAGTDNDDGHSVRRCAYYGVNSDLGPYILLWQMLLKGCL
jgi:hypothetical protein